MVAQIRKFYFYFLLINITFAANGWDILGLPIGQLIYWGLLFLGIVLLFETKYSTVSVCLFFMTLFLKICNSFFDIPLTGVISEFTSALIFILIGANLYGRNPRFIYRQLLSFFALSIPFMIIQKIGIHVFFYGWSTEVFHDNGIYSFDAIKDKGVLLKNIPLSPALFVELKDLVYVIYQGRPTGLLYSNNVLSVIISIALALHFSIHDNIRSNIKYIIIALIVVLTGSSLVFGVLILLFIYFYFIRRDKNLKLNALKTMSLTLFMFIVHYLFFPGLTASYFGQTFQTSFVFRFAEIFHAFGFDYFNDFIIFYNLKIDLDQKDSYSLIGSLVKNKFIFLFGILFLIFVFVYYIHLKLNKRLSLVYIVLFTVCIITQFAVNFILAPSFQLFFGIALFPIVQAKAFKSEILR
jgi:hypothetical protein